MQNLIYFLRVEAHDCNYAITVNGIKLISETNGYPITVEFPINESIIASNLKAKAVLTPVKPEQFIREEAACHLSIITTIDGVKDSREVVQVFKTPDFKPNYHNIYVHDIIFEKNLPSFHFYLNELKPLYNDLKLDKEVSDLYYRFHAALKDKNYEKIKLLSRFRDIDYSSAYYVSYEFRVADIKETCEEYFQNHSLKLLDLNLKDYKLKHFHDDKLWCLEDEDGDQPIVYLNNIADTATLLPLYIGKLETGEFAIMR